MNVYLLKNHKGQFLGKQLDWHNELPVKQLFFTEHRDIALNTLIELNAKEVELRINIIQTEADEKGLPLIDKN